MNNISVSGYIKIEEVMRDPAFRVGYDDAVNGSPFRYDFPPNSVAGQFSYERGRILGQIYKGKLRKNGRTQRDAIDAMCINVDLF